jgi:hypothetical protein
MDNQGAPLITVSTEVEVKSVSFLDLFLNDGTVEVTVEGKKGLNAVNVKLA